MYSHSVANMLSSTLDMVVIIFHYHCESQKVDFLLLLLLKHMLTGHSCSYLHNIVLFFRSKVTRLIDCDETMESFSKQLLSLYLYVWGVCLTWGRSGWGCRLVECSSSPVALHHKPEHRGWVWGSALIHGNSHHSNPKVYWVDSFNSFAPIASYVYTCTYAPFAITHNDRLLRLVS